MLKEEKELRNYIACEPDIESRCQRGLYRLITALVKAVREDCARAAHDQYCTPDSICCCDAIRGRK